MKGWENQLGLIDALGDIPDSEPDPLCFLQVRLELLHFQQQPSRAQLDRPNTTPSSSSNYLYFQKPSNLSNIQAPRSQPSAPNFSNFSGNSSRLQSPAGGRRAAPTLCWAENASVSSGSFRPPSGMKSAMSATTAPGNGRSGLGFGQSSSFSRLPSVVEKSVKSTAAKQQQQQQQQQIGGLSVIGCLAPNNSGTFLIPGGAQVTILGGCSNSSSSTTRKNPNSTVTPGIPGQLPKLVGAKSSSSSGASVAGSCDLNKFFQVRMQLFSEQKRAVQKTL